jgi:RNA-directed DNA polymerase
MLDALERGVKGGRWFSLRDKVLRPATLESSFRDVLRNRGAAGVDGVVVGVFDRHRERNLARLGENLTCGKYRPQPVRRVWIEKADGGKRPLGIPTVADRVVQGALRKAIEPIFERDFSDRSYGFRPERSQKDALRCVQRLLDEDRHWVLDGDIKGYFDSIPHEALMARIELKVADGWVLEMIRRMLKAPVQEGESSTHPVAGTPQGGVISPLLANIYLDPLDHLMAQNGFEMVRYADDFVVLCKSQEEAEAARSLVEQWMKDNGLELHPEKTRITDSTTPKGGFGFLGYHFERGRRWIRPKAMKAFRAKIREQTPRLNGKSTESIIARLNRTLRGWFEYFKHSIRTSLVAADEFVRRRLRSILKRRHRMGGTSAKGRSHQLWPNNHFTQLGLFSLVAAQDSAVAATSRNR